LFSELLWDQSYDDLPFPAAWLSKRGYRFSFFYIEQADFVELLACPGNWSYASCNLLMNQRVETKPPALDLLHLIEISHRIKSICLFQDEEETNPQTWLRILAYLAEHVHDLQEINFYGISAETVIEALKLFPMLTSVDWNQCHGGGAWERDMSELMTIPVFPSIKSFVLSSSAVNLEPQVTSAIIRACSNLTCLNSRGVWVIDGLSDVLKSCRYLTALRIQTALAFNLDGGYDRILPIVAEHGSRLNRVEFKDHGILNLRLNASKAAMNSIIHQVNHLDLGLSYEYEKGNISALFEPSSDIHLQYLKIDTHDEDADMIAQILKACHNISTLELRGKIAISPMIKKIPHNCHQLESLELDYEGSVDGLAMRDLLLSCPKLESLDLHSPLDVEAYESLALYGGSLYSFLLEHRRNSSQPAVPINLLSFSSNLLVFDPNFKQKRKQVMKRIFQCSLCPQHQEFGSLLILLWENRLIQYRNTPLLGSITHP
jgi:hypothetical protein